MKFEINTIQVSETTIHTLSFSYFAPEDVSGFLTAEEKNRLENFGSMSRKQEFAATRLLKHQIFGFKPICYNDVGAPFIEDAGYISISHAGNTVAIGINAHYQIGLDLEPLRGKILRVSHKFTGKKDVPDKGLRDIHRFTKLWSGKECLYKLAGRKKIIFSDELILEHTGGDTYHGTIVNPDHRLSGELTIFEREGIIYSVNTHAFKKH